MPITKQHQPKINIVTLGCSKNSVDSEFLAGALQSQGLQVVHESEDQGIDIVIINTCGFILDAKEESIETILQYASLKKKGQIKHLVVMGCLSQRYKSELTAELEEVDAIFGVNQIQDIVELLAPSKLVQPYIPSRLLSTPPHYAHLKVSEGCDRRCSFCAIPSIRGNLISRTREALVEEAAVLAAGGVKELILIAQDLTAYGQDLYGKPALPELLEDLLQLDGPEWIRLHYAYPSGVSDQLLELMTGNHRICAYLDVPFQHINNRILHSMRRGHLQEDIRRLMDKVRTRFPQLAVRTTFIVGYPGETQDEFDELCEFVKTYRFERMGAFMYSHEDDTHAYLLNDDVAVELKQERLETLMEIQEQISYENNQQLVGKDLIVLLDEKLPDGSFIGRSEYDAPEIDNSIIVQPHATLEVGTFTTVTVQAASAFDLDAKKLPTFDQ